MTVELPVTPQALVIISTICMVLAASVLALIFELLRARYSPPSGDAEEPYLCGEPPDVVSSVTPRTVNLYWGFVKSIAKSLYKYFRDVMHSGRLSDWAGYMCGWYGFLMILSLIHI